MRRAARPLVQRFLHKKERRSPRLLKIAGIVEAARDFCLHDRKRISEPVRKNRITRGKPLLHAGNGGVCFFKRWVFHGYSMACRA